MYIKLNNYSNSSKYGNQRAYICRLPVLFDALLLGHVKMQHHCLESISLLLQLQLQLRHHLHLHTRLRRGPVVQVVLFVQVPVTQ